MSTHYNNVAQQVSGTPGTGTITLGSAVTGAQTLGSATGGTNATVDVFITDGNSWEVARNCSYTHSGTTLTRGTLEASSTGSVLSLTSSAIVRVAMPASTGTAVDNVLGAWGALDGENSITGTATAVIGRLNVCSGTTSDYTVTLPAVSGNAGRYIGFRMDSALTRFVTLDGNASETIDGALTRVMWAQETALLYCNGTTWTKVAGKSRPMACGMYRSSNQGSITRQVSTTVTLDTVDFDNTGLMASTGSNLMTVRRGATYVVTSVARWLNLPEIGVYSSYIFINGTTDFVHEYGAVVSTTGTNINPHIGVTVPRTFSTGDTVRLRVYASPGTGGPFTVVGGIGASYLVMQEVPQW